jgi:indolepyruvate ferredoxin oxidoreductase beta subunit
VQEAEKLGDKRCANVLLLGALSTQLDLDREVWNTALRERLPEKTLKRNLRAFERGRQLAAGSAV